MVHQYVSPNYCFNIVTGRANTGSMLGIIYLHFKRLQVDNNTLEAHSDIKAKWWLKMP